MIYGPFVKSATTGTSYRFSRWYRSVPVNHSSPLAYYLDTYGALPNNNRPDWDSWGPHPIYTFGYESNTALMKARERFNNQIGSDAALGVTLVEYKQSMNMIVQRAGQLLSFVKSLKRGKFGDAWYTLYESATSRGYVRDPPKGLHRGKPWASNFLEWHFGWSPLIQDIHDSVEVLQGSPPANPVRARATERHGTHTNHPAPGPGIVWWESLYGWVRVELAAEVYVSNPNLRLASQLGLVNPATLAWEVVPFSFVVDWFVPVGSFLNQWTDFFGLELLKARTTTTGRVESKQLYSVPGAFEDRQFKYRYSLDRALGISDFKLQPRRVTGISATRAATAISLLIQQLRS